MTSASSRPSDQLTARAYAHRAGLGDRNSLPNRPAQRSSPAGEGRFQLRLRALGAAGAMMLAFGLIGGQLVNLALKGQVEVSSNLSTPIATGYSRPDIVDRKGRLLASDIAMSSLYANPSVISDHDEVIEKLRSVFADFDAEALRAKISDRSKRFVWIKRGLAPAVAQQVHELGIPGLSFREELRRAYPAGRLAGHVLGHVDIDNKGIAGLERYLDDSALVDPVNSALLTSRAPVRMSIDLGVQHALDDTLADAMTRYRSKGVAGVVLDVHTGEVVAATSLPGVDPMRPTEGLSAQRRDRLSASTYELGSIFKPVTIAMALDDGMVTPGTVLDVRQPLVSGRFEIKDMHPHYKPLTVAEVFVKSSNVGVAMLARQAGVKRQKEFLARVGLLGPLRTESGPVAKVQAPDYWDDTTALTSAYGHGVAVAPMQFAASAAALVNGGRLVQPTFLRQSHLRDRGKRVICEQTSQRVRRLMRRNVLDARGTGRRAAVPGYRVGGKTGTAEIAARGRYKEKSVISSFVGAFPMEAPRYLTLVLIFEPQGTPETKGHITAGLNAAPTTARLVKRIAPLLGVPSKHRKGGAG